MIMKEEVKILKALAHPLRFDIIKLIANMKDSICVCKIQSHFETGQSNLSQHLKILRDADLVETKKDGGWVEYSLKNKNIIKLLEILEKV